MSLAVAASFYVPDGELFISTECTRGPWNPEHQHAGPPSALMGRGLLQAAADFDRPFHPARITIEIKKPIPLAPLRLSVQSLGGGRSVRRLGASLTAGGDVVCSASAVFIRTEDVALPPLEVPAPPARLPADCGKDGFPFFRDDTGYHESMELKFARGGFGKGPSMAWMRMRVPLVPDERPAPLERVLIAADSGNGVSWSINPAEYLFINPDLTVYLHRLPVGDWVAIDATTSVHPNGVGLADTLLWDERGPIGRSDQSLLVAKR